MRFSIRDILLLTVIVALATGWALDRWRLARRAAELELRSQQLRFEAEISRAEALLQRDSSIANLQRAALLEEAQKFYAEVQTAQAAADEAK